MRINHLIIGSRNVQESIKFYCFLLGFEETGQFNDTGTGKQGNILSKISENRLLQILIVPFSTDRLPSPSHIAFEVDIQTFSDLFNRLLSENISIRKNPSLNDNTRGIGLLKTILCDYNIFYITDPAGINIEIMVASDK